MTDALEAVDNTTCLLIFSVVDLRRMSARAPSVYGGAISIEI